MEKIATSKKIRKNREYRMRQSLLLTGLLIFFLCGCNRTEIEYKLGDSSQEESSVSVESVPETEQTASGETEDVPEKATLSEEKTDAPDIQIYICGAVQTPGVYKLPAGSRVVQAVEAAGGLLPEAEEKSLNQARLLEDGEQITVWTQEEAEADPSLEKAASGKEDAASSGKVNLNTADKETLMSLPGIGESRAEAILSYRQSRGKFQKIEEIMEIEGIKEKMFEKIKDSIEV